MWTTIALFYFSCMVFGFVFALIGAIVGEIGGHMHLDIGGHHPDICHVNIEHPEGHVPSHEIHAGITEENMPSASVFNAITISTFIGFFGIAGLVAVWGFKLSALPSLIFALPTAFVFAAVEFILYVKVFVKAQASSEATLSETLGSEAEVLASIPTDRVGQIAYVIKGCRFTAPAYSDGGIEIARGTKVIIVNLRGTTYVVRPV